MGCDGLQRLRGGARPLQRKQPAGPLYWLFVEQHCLQLLLPAVIDNLYKNPGARSVPEINHNETQAPKSHDEIYKSSNLGSQMEKMNFPEYYNLL